MYLKINFPKKIFKSIKFLSLSVKKKELFLVKYKLQFFFYILYPQTTGRLEGFQSKAQPLG